MLLHEREIEIPHPAHGCDMVEHYAAAVAEALADGEVPVRFVITDSTGPTCKCELGVVTGMTVAQTAGVGSIFQYAQRGPENQQRFTAVMLVPTGIGAVLGGHAGDAGPAARLLAGACDTLITHPNVVNASDINELPENGLYVEGSVICRMLMGTAALQPVRNNRVLMVMDEHPDIDIAELTVNAASAARATLGQASAGVVRMDPPIHMTAAFSSSGSAVGQVEHLERLCKILDERKGTYDAIALSTLIHVPPDTHETYFGTMATGEENAVNPWGGVEAMLTHSVSMLYDVPSAHAPLMEDKHFLAATFGVVDPRMSAEVVSRCFIHCVMKGVNNSPRIVTDRAAFRDPGILAAADVSCMIVPDGCVGLPTLAACGQGIPVIAVRENTNRMCNDLSALPFADGQLHVVENYLEAVGVMTALKAGVAVDTVRRPMPQTVVDISTTDS